MGTRTSCAGCTQTQHHPSPYMAKEIFLDLRNSSQSSCPEKCQIFMDRHAGMTCNCMEKAWGWVSHPIEGCMPISKRMAFITWCSGKGITDRNRRLYATSTNTVPCIRWCSGKGITDRDRRQYPPSSNTVLCVRWHSGNQHTGTCCWEKITEITT